MTGNILPGIGRNGLTNSVRKLSGANVTGYRPVSDTAEFIAGMVATLVDDGGIAKTAVADNTSASAIGLFFCHKTNSFYRPVVAESKTFASNIITLDYANILSSSVKVTNSLGTVTYSGTTAYSVNATNGIITRNTSTGTIGATETVLVTYRYKDANLTGIDQTLGSGNAAILEEPAEVATLVYDTSRTYTLNEHLHVNADGLVSNSGGSLVVGVVTKVPSNDNPELCFKLKIAVA